MSCGIYKITNIINGKIYIGCSLDCEQRFIKHKSKLNKNKSNNQHLQNAWNKDGKDSFKFEVIYLCNQQDLENSEIYFINTFNSNISTIGYNKHIGGRVMRGGINHPCYGKIMSKEEKEKRRLGCIGKNLGKKHTKETKLKISIAGKGRKFTKEALVNVSIANKNKNLGKHHSEESKIKMMKSHKRIMVIQLKNNINIKIWDSISLAERELNIRHIKECCDNIYKTAGGFEWIYYNKQ